jgi:hypothetical protein
MFGFSFLSPAFLLGALVAALPVALHLLGRRPQARVLFAAVRLLKRAPARETRRRRLRELVLLGLRVTAIVLLACAFARPYLAQPASTSSRAAVVVALDRSLSMSAPGQFDRAVTLARDAIARVAPGASVGLLAFDDDAELLVKPTPDRSAVLRALGLVQPGYGGTSYATALARAADVLGPAAGQVVVVTDLQRVGWDRRDAAIPDNIGVVVQDAGAPASNVSVSDVRRGDHDVTAIVRNSGPIRRTGRARLSINGRVRGVMPFALDAAGVAEISFPITVPPTGEASVDIDDASGYQADNTAYALLDAPDPPALVAITGQGDPSRGAFYLQRALEVDRGQLFHLDTELADRFSSHVTPSALRRDAAVILLGTRGLTPAAATSLGEYVAEGGGLLVALDDQVEPAALDRLLGTRLSVSFESAARSTSVGILPADTRHPILQSLEADALGAVRFERVARADVQQATVLARFADGSPALVERRHGAGRVLLFGSDLSNRWNDLPLQPAFLPLVHQVARYLARDRMPVREFVVASAPAGVAHRPGVMTLAASLIDMQKATGPGAPLPKRIVVNVDPRESDVGRISVAQFEQAIARSGNGGTRRAPVSGRPVEQQQGLWRLAIALAIVALLVEGLVGKTVRT